MSEQRCHSILHTHTRPTLDERCEYDEGHLGPHSFDWKDGKWDEDAVADLGDTVSDGRGNEWPKCSRPDCGLEVIRPGQVQCNCEWDEQMSDLEQNYEQAELETPDIDEETWTNRHWLLIVGVGLVGIGLLIRWWLRRK